MFRNFPLLYLLFGILLISATIASVFWSRHLMRRAGQAKDLGQKNRITAAIIAIPLMLLYLAIAGGILYCILYL
jgi:hypothetical protein